MSNQSTSDLFIEAMTRLRDLDKFTGNDEPMRHHVRRTKHAAEQIIENACRLAITLAYHAADLPEDVKRITDEARAVTTNERTEP